MSFIKQLDRNLEGLPDTTLTIILVILGLLALGVAFFGSPSLKVALAAWYIFP